MELSKYKPLDHADWLNFRNGHIGGADAGAAAGMNPHCSPYSLWAEKTGKVPGFEGNLITEVGSYLEEFVARKFEQETGKKVKKCNFTLVNSEYPWACADVDRMIVGEDAILECKTTNSFLNVRKFKNEEFPEQWLAQCIHYLAVTGKKKAYLAVLSECKEFHIFEIERDQEEIDALMEIERDFWKYVETDTPPSVDGSESTGKAIDAIYNESTVEEIELIGYETQLQRRQMLKDTIKEMQAEVEEIDNEIKTEMKDAGAAKCGDYYITRKAQTRHNFNSKLFKKEHPEVNFKAYEKESTAIVFTVKESKKGE